LAGWRVHGRSEKVRGRGIGYDVVHSAVDDHSRLAYCDIHDAERGETCAASLARALALFAAHGITIQRVMTDDAFAYRHGASWMHVLADRGITHIFRHSLRQGIQAGLEHGRKIGARVVPRVRTRATESRV
jgi:hypothetical protein